MSLKPRCRAEQVTVHTSRSKDGRFNSSPTGKELEIERLRKDLRQQSKKLDLVIANIKRGDPKVLSQGKSRYACYMFMMSSRQV